MNHLQLHQAALPDLSVNQISRLPKDQLAQFSYAVQELHDWTIQMRGRINRGLEQRYDEQIRQANSFGEEDSARFRIDDGDLQIDVSQPKEIVWPHSTSSSASLLLRTGRGQSKCQHWCRVKMGSLDAHFR